MQVPTVKIKHPDGYAIINAADFDPKAHEEYAEMEVKKPAAPPKAPVLTDADAPLAAKHVAKGWYGVFRGDAEEPLVSDLTKGEAAAFNEMDVDGKVAFVAERAKAA